MSLVLAAQPWPTNAELIRDIAKLGYLDIDVPTIDVTYELGIWWQLWRPHDLTALNRQVDGTDFRHLDYPDGTWRQVAYDPPYCAMGGRSTSDIGNYNSRYGRDVVESSALSVQQLINDGLTEMWRITAPGGIVLCKMQNYIWNNSLHLGVHWTTTHAIALGFMVEDTFYMTSDSGSVQPKLANCLRCRASILRRSDHETWTDRTRTTEPSAVCRRPWPFLPHRPDLDVSTQRHAAQNVSMMLALRKPAGKRPPQYPQPEPTPTLF